MANTQDEIASWRARLGVSDQELNTWELAIVMTFHSYHANIRASLGLPKVTKQQTIDNIRSLAADLTQASPPNTAEYGDGFGEGFG